MKKIFFTNGKYAIVDDNDFEWLSKYAWTTTQGGYVRHSAWDRERHRGYSVSMHRLITGAKAGEQVDHINRVVYDNRRSNLRICNISQNMMNRGKSVRNKSGYKGVFWETRRGLWCARLKTGGVTRTIGYSDNPQELSLLFEQAAKKLHGEFYFKP